MDLASELADRLQAAPNLRVVICTPKFSDFANVFTGFHRQHYLARFNTFTALQMDAPDRVVLFHPVGFPGRPAFIRTTTIIVDDIWSLVGATHFRRRGMTFDGSLAIASFDRQLADGYSTAVRAFRRQLMAEKINSASIVNGQAPGAEFARLSQPLGAFDLIQDLLSQGGHGRIEPLWRGPTDTTVLPVLDVVADPDGSNGTVLETTLAGMFNVM